MKLTLTTLGYYLFVLLGILALVTAQCTEKDVRLELLFENEVFADSTLTLNKTVGDSFVIGCRRCRGARAPTWFNRSNSLIEILDCNISKSSVCTEYDPTNNLVRYLSFTSATMSVAGVYRCTRQSRQSQVTIKIDELDTATSVNVMFSQSRYSIDEDKGSLQIVLMLNTSLTTNVTIQVISNDDTATRDSDYIPGPYSVMIPAGRTSGLYQIPIVVENMTERDESFRLIIDPMTLPDGIILGSPNDVIVTIENDDTTHIGFEQPTYIVSEGSQLVQPVIMLSNPMSTEFTILINERAMASTATDDKDYSSGPYSVTLPAEMTKVSFNISIIDDDMPEPDEDVRLAISNNAEVLPNYIEIERRFTTVTIIDDDDSNTVTVKFNQEMYAINESDGLVKPVLILSDPLPTDLSLQVMTVDSSATIDDNDYHPGPYNVTFVAGQTNVSFNVLINDDTVLEADESFELIFDASLSSNVEVLGINNQIAVSILNDDSSVVKFNQPVYNVNEDDELVQPKLILSNPSSADITVQVNDERVIATGGDDYNSGPYIIQFPAGVISALFNVSITKDNVSEGNENFNLMINSSTLPKGVTVDATGNTMIIVNDRNKVESSKDNSSSNATGAVVGVVVVLLIMIALIITIIILLLIYYKKRSKHATEHTDNGIELNENGKASKTTDSDEPYPTFASGVLLKVPPKAKDAEVKEITTSIGQPTTLFAELPYADQSEIIWKKNGEPINHLILSDSSLYINDTGLNDQGDYTVTATGSDDATSEIIRLTVINPIMPTCMSKHLPVKVGDFPEHVALMQSDDGIRFEREFDKITVDIPFSQHAAKLYANSTKNRYRNIIPYDHSRVVLTQLDNKSGRDYINASFIDGYKEARAYIAAQGPLSNTVEDFWRMVWEHKVTTIVMLTRLIEDAKAKCHQYWPKDEFKIYGDFKVTVVKQEIIAKYAARTFMLEKVSNQKSEIHEVQHFHYMAWPDHGVPKYGKDLLEFQKRIDKHHKRKNDTPMLVHCSAGVGRSGTFIAIDIELQRIKHENVVDVYNCVCRLRFCRDLMVQSEAQYELIHTALLEYITCGDTSITAPTENVQDKINQLSAVDPYTKKTGFQLQFEKLTKASPKEKEFTYSDATSSLNRKKNRSNKFVPSDHTRARLSQTDDESDYVNASYIDGYRHCKAFLVGPGPMESTISDFWRMIWEKQSFAIVMLGQLIENGEEASCKYWPDKDSEIQLRNFVIETTDEEPIDKNVMKRVIKITHKQTNANKIITQLQYVEWSPKSCPTSPTSVVDLLEILEHVQRKTSNGPITIHCSDGVGRSGTFCALMISINRFKAEQMTDIFQTINTMRTQKPGVVIDAEQYKYIHEALVAMLKRYSNYANFTVENSL